jgi:hypothetical protein
MQIKNGNQIVVSLGGGAALAFREPVSRFERKYQNATISGMQKDLHVIATRRSPGGQS